MKMILKRRIAYGFILLIFCLMMIDIRMISVSAKTQTSMSDQGFKPAKHLKKKERDRYYSNSAFVGNSISKGLHIYFNSSGKGVCGHPIMLVQGSYSFYNDKNSGSQYQITYRGKGMRAKEAIAAAKVKRVFINMGSNDLWKPYTQTYQDYVQYIRGIRKRNPKVVIFIQGTTPVCNSRNKKYLNNSAIQALNKKMEKYCSCQKNMYYVDISKGLTTAEGELQKKYSSDDYMHITMAGYQIWAKNLNSYVSKLLLQEKNAKAAVDWAAQKKTKDSYNTARKWVNRLEQSTMKQKLQNRLKRIQKQIKDSEPNPDEKNAEPNKNTVPVESKMPAKSTPPKESMAPAKSAPPAENTAPAESTAPK